jgi:hypothetical protein
MKNFHKNEKKYGFSGNEAFGRFEKGRQDALDALLPLVYDELQRLAHRLLQNEHAETLTTTTLVYEAYLKLINQHSVDWENRVR